MPLRGRPDAQVDQSVRQPQSAVRKALKGRYQIEVVDLLEHPDRARGDQIVAIPTLVIKLPPPVRKIIGDLSEHGTGIGGP